MLPEWRTYFEFVGALSTLAGAMAWWRRGSYDEDACVAAAADVVTDALADADKVAVIDIVTGRNLRDQVTVEEAINLDQERSLRRWPWRN